MAFLCVRLLFYGISFDMYGFGSANATLQLTQIQYSRISTHVDESISKALAVSNFV